MRACFAVLLLTALAVPVRAEPEPANNIERAIPPGSTITIVTPGQKVETITLRPSEPSQFLLSRTTVEALRAEGKVAEELRPMLLKCQDDVALLAQHDDAGSGWSGLKWGGVGAAIVAAFVAGLMIGH